MGSPTFRQQATLLGGTYSASGMAKAELVGWPPSPSVSLRKMLAFQPKVISIPPPAEPGQPRTTIGSGYFAAPADLLDPIAAPMDCTSPTTDGRVDSALRAAAQARDGNAILKRVAGLVAGNYAVPGTTSQDLITAMTQLAVTGSNAFAAWSANPTTDLTPFLTGMPSAAAATASAQIMSDFDAAIAAVRNPGAGMNENSLRQGLKNNWIAVSGEDDPPDYPVNVAIAEYPQYRVSVTVPTPAGPNSGIDVSIRYIVASSQSSTTVPVLPTVPPGNEVVLFIHGEGSRAEEAADFIPALFSVGAAAGRSFTVIAFDQPGCGYSTMVPHLSIAPMPPTSGVFGVIDTSSFAGSPILDFVYNAMTAFVETVVLPFGNPITAIVGGSLGGHMALRLAASQNDWVRNVIAWSPACVMETDASVMGVSLPHRLLSDPTLASAATDGPNPPWPATQENETSRGNFFNTVWCQNTFSPPNLGGAGVIASALVGAAYFAGPVAAVLIGTVAIAITNMSTLAPQPQLWYRDGWASKPTYIEESRLDRREVYNTNFRQWHWRICEEMLGYTFSPASMNKPLLLMVGEIDDYNYVHFLGYVKAFAAALKGPAQGGLTIQDTGHSIHNERPYFLAHQVVNFASPV